MKKSYGVILIGCGHIGEQHIQEIYDKHEATIIATIDTNEDIARQFGLTKSGVKFHLLTIFRKLDVSNRSEAVAVAIRRHLVADS